MNRRVSILDLGTNTFHLLVTEGNRVLHEERRPVRIGMGGINNNMITAEGLDRALACLKDYKKKSDLFGVAGIYAIGTSAFRGALNSGQVVEAILSATGIEVRIISGELEAELIYDGIRSGLGSLEEVSMMVDIGGGSVEFIIAGKSGIIRRISLETGGQRLMELFQKNDPILSEEITAVENHLEKNLVEVFNAIDLYHPETLIGSSGSFDTLSEIWCRKKNISYEPGPETPLTVDGFYEIAGELLSLDRAGRMAIPGMIELRVDMIVVGCIVIRFLLQKAQFKRLRVSGYSLKEGVRWRVMSGLSL
ncbi:MAG: exopolyphosphatase [Cyclobacteriaceae bacterium]